MSIKIDLKKIKKHSKKKKKKKKKKYFSTYQTRSIITVVFVLGLK